MAADNNARARAALGSAPAPGTNAIATTVQGLLTKESVKARFMDILGAKAPGFISSVINVTNGSRQLKECDPSTIVASAAVAASLDLPVDPNLGFAHIVPYVNKGKKEAQFQIGYKGYVQLALRAGQYKTINVGPVYEGEIEASTSRERLMGQLRFATDPKPSTKIMGYAAYFQLLNGAEKWDYMTMAEVEAHAKKYSKSYAYDSSPWKTQFDSMACKTVLKRLLSHYGILSIQMQTAVLADQAIVRENAEGDTSFDYADNGAVDAEYETGPRDDAPTALPEPKPTLDDLLGAAPKPEAVPVLR